LVYLSSYILYSAYLDIEILGVFGVHLDVRMRIGLVQAAASTGLGSRVEMEVVSTSRQVVGVLFADSIIRCTVVA
jgi:hypothetical protein